jgi:ribose transport system substrate-binding protein
MKLAVVLLAALVAYPAHTWAQAKPKIVVFTKNVTNPFWRAVRIGADKAAKDLGAEVEHAAPTKPDNIEEQTRLVEDWMVRKPVRFRAGGLQGAGAEHSEGQQGRHSGGDLLQPHDRGRLRHLRRLR